MGSARPNKLSKRLATNLDLQYPPSLNQRSRQVINGTKGEERCIRFAVSYRSTCIGDPFLNLPSSISFPGHGPVGSL